MNYLNLNKHLLCNHFKNGTCNFGDKCLFSHDSSTATPIPDDVCLFHLKGNCYRASCCQFKHINASELLNSKENNKAQQVSKKNLASSSVISNKSFASATSLNLKLDIPHELSKVDLCSFFMAQGMCPYSHCSNVHGEKCELCGDFAMHPFNEQRRLQHTKECTDRIEREMEESFAYERSKDLICGICLDVILEKESRGESRFGLLTNCDHVFCLGCIREWRSSNADQRQGCPQCRIKSFFVIPSEYFYDTTNNKTKVIEDYKKALSNKPCKYFKANGKCPFFSACFYSHKDAQGNPVVLPMPNQVRRMTNGILDIVEDGDTDLVFLIDSLGFDEEVTQTFREYLSLYEFD